MSGQSRELTRPSRQKEILGMQCDRLISNLKGPKTIALVKENIRQIPDGSLSHCAGALNLVFKKAFELKKKKRQPPGVKLRCSNYHCSWNQNPVSISIVGTNAGRCTCCGGRYYKQCVGCGYNRTANYVACQSCNKVFV